MDNLIMSSALLCFLHHGPKITKMLIKSNAIFFSMHNVINLRKSKKTNIVMERGYALLLCVVGKE